jgi:hypothetical protein
LNLLIEYFKPSNDQRHKEYLKCLESNIKNSHISKIHIFTEGEIPPIESEKITFIKSESRPTYKTFFDYCSENLKGEICIVSNSDIIFDQSLGYINSENIEGKFLALSRWDLIENRIRHYDIPYSQDCWIFKSPISIPNCEFRLGTLGCDNRITYLAMKAGYIVTNPSRKIVTKHLHTSNFRTVSRDQKEMVRGMYLFVDSNDNVSIPSENFVCSPEEVSNVIRHIQRKKSQVNK